MRGQLPREERQTFRSPIATTIFTYLFGTVGRWRTSLMSRARATATEAEQKRHRPMRNVCNEMADYRSLERSVLVMELVIPLYQSGLWETVEHRYP